MAGIESGKIEREWLPALRARQLLKGLLDEDLEATGVGLMRYASTGAVASRCQVMREWTDEDSVACDQRDRDVGGEFWHRFVDQGGAEASDWKTGFFHLRWYAERTYVHVAIYGVEFDAAAIRAVAPPPLTVAAAAIAEAAVAASPEKPTVRRSDLEDWHEVFKQVHPAGVEALALRSATAMFPDNHVPRQWVRELRGPQKRGKPPIRRE